MVEFAYQEMFPLGEDPTEYRLLSREFVSTDSFNGLEILKIAPQGLTPAGRKGRSRMSRTSCAPGHLALLAEIFKDPEASANDKMVALEMLKNAVISAEGPIPHVSGHRHRHRHGQKRPAGLDGRRATSRPLRKVFSTHTPATNLRYSQECPLKHVRGEKYRLQTFPPKSNSTPPRARPTNSSSSPKGAGSANKTYLFQETKAVLTPATLLPFMVAKMKTLGTAACPPYHLAFVVGGTSAELNLKNRQAGLCGLPGRPARDRQPGGPRFPRQGA